MGVPTHPVDVPVMAQKLELSARAQKALDVNKGH